VTGPASRLRQVVPFLRVASMESSLRFYVDGLGFELANRWVVDGRVRWCCLQGGGAALMLQEFPREGHDSWVPDGKVGVGVSINFICDDARALHRDASARGLSPTTPYVGNRMWVTTLTDPDGYRLDFESPAGEVKG
jgi:lactoylglutathione lyase